MWSTICSFFGDQVKYIAMLRNKHGSFNRILQTMPQKTEYCDKVVTAHIRKKKNNYASCRICPCRHIEFCRYPPLWIRLLVQCKTMCSWHEYPHKMLQAHTLVTCATYQDDTFCIKTLYVRTNKQIIMDVRYFALKIKCVRYWFYYTHFACFFAAIDHIDFFLIL